MSTLYEHDERQLDSIASPAAAPLPLEGYQSTSMSHIGAFIRYSQDALTLPSLSFSLTTDGQAAAAGLATRAAG